MKTKAQAKEKGTHWSRILIIITVVSATLACSVIETSTPTTHPTSAPTRTSIPTWTPIPSATPTQKPTTGEISGQVIDASSGSPILNANVTTDPPTISVTAGAQGRYIVPEVPPGVYTITATKPGYTSASVEIAVTAGKTTTADVHLTAMPSPTPQASLTDGLVAYYPFNGNADDESGNGNHGIVHGAILTDDRLGNPDSAYSFDGVDDYIASSSNISLDTIYSVALWFKYTESTGNATLFQRGYQGWCWYEPKIHISEASTLKAHVSGCSGEGAVGTSEITPGEWYHVAIVTRNGSQEFYVNGEKIASTTHTLRYTFAYKAFIGASANQNTPVGEYFHGTIDDVRIYNRTLSEAEVQALYREGEDASLVAYYPLNGNADDASGNGNHGIVYGATLTTDRLGNPNSAYSFDGINDYIQASGHYDFSSQNELTIVAWFKLDGHAEHDGIVSAHDCCSYRLMVSPELHPYYDAGTHQDVQVETYTFKLEKWYHYVMTIGEGTAKIFVNGEMVFESSQSVPKTLPDVYNAFVIGSGEKYPKQKWFTQGTIDDVRIYNRALSEAEIQALYREGGWASESSLSWPRPSSNRATLNTDAFNPGLPPMLLPANHPAGDCTGSQNRV